MVGTNPTRRPAFCWARDQARIWGAVWKICMAGLSGWMERERKEIELRIPVLGDDALEESEGVKS